MLYYDVSLFGELDIYLFREGTHTRLYEKFGCHVMEREGRRGAYFAVWAPHAKFVSVVGDFNHYDASAAPLKKREDGSGIWEGFIEDVHIGQTYKYHILTPYDTVLLKADPYGYYHEKPPLSASRVWSLEGYRWQDEAWMQKRPNHNRIGKPISIYELHINSWNMEYSNYVDFAQAVVEYVKEQGFTHIEIMPITEYPFAGSWGYQVTGYFAPTARFGAPQEFMEFVDIFHRADIGVILDWVPSHFVTDGHGLVAFDGEALYEYADPRKGYHPEWKSAVFDYGKGEVRSFLLSSAHFWCDRYHIDGLRVDAVASMLYLDYARKEGEWIPNIYGGNENLEAISFLKQLNETLYGRFDGIMTIAEESTAFPKVTWPVYAGGLGFGFKWNMGWMHDVLEYFKVDPLFRKYHHHQITFSFVYAFSENYILPLSHDEVVHMKGSLLSKMPGDENQKFANLRALLAFMWLHPGKKLLFMGGEFGQKREWSEQRSLDWELLNHPLHKGLLQMVRELNALYRSSRALYEQEERAEGFAWIEGNDWEREVLVFVRKSLHQELVVVCNFADFHYASYRLGVPQAGSYRQIFSSQDLAFGGWGLGNEEAIQSEPIPSQGKEHSLVISLPPLSVVVFEKEPQDSQEKKKSEKIFLDEEDELDSAVSKEIADTRKGKSP